MNQFVPGFPLQFGDTLGRMASLVGSPSTLGDGLVGHWEFEDDVTDSSGSGYDGTAVNSPTYVTGKVGAKAIDLNGSSQRVTLGDIAIFDNLSAFSVSLWMNPDAYSATVSVIRKDGTLTPLQISTGTTLRIVFFPLSVLTISAVPAIGSWTHVVIRWDKTVNSGKPEVFFNNVSQGSTATGFTSNTNTTGTKTMVFGGTESGGELYNGRLDDIRIYNRRVTDSEVAALYALT